MSALEQPKVIIADDIPAVRQTMARSLVRAGWKVTLAAHGGEVITLARAEAPDLFILDWCMGPEVSGIDALKVLKVDPATLNIPVLIYSGLRRGREDELVALQNGASLFLDVVEIGAPVNGEFPIVRYAEMLLGRELPRINLAVVIEDDLEQQDFVKACLDARGVPSLYASSAKAGLELVRQRKPDLLLLDIGLRSELDGCALLKIFKQEEASKDAAVFVMTAQPDHNKALRNMALAAGADGFLEKPFSETQLLLQFGSLAASRQRARFGNGNGNGHPHILERGGIRVDVEARRVWVGGRLLETLGPKRFDLLCLLFCHESGLDRNAILERVWGRSFGNVRVVDINILRLRRDLDDPEGRTIVSIPGGYKLVGQMPFSRR